MADNTLPKKRSESDSTLSLLIARGEAIMRQCSRTGVESPTALKTAFGAE